MLFVCVCVCVALTSVGFFLFLFFIKPAKHHKGLLCVCHSGSGKMLLVFYVKYFFFFNSLVLIQSEM